MSQTAAHPVDHVIPHVPVRQWVLSLPIPLRVLLAAQPELVTPVLQVVLKLKTPWRDDSTHLVMSPREFMQWLAALVERTHLSLGLPRSDGRTTASRNRIARPLLPLRVEAV